eukprot:TRINITY_DN640_c0_g1_i1.p1 TRINITY_DN640_c0_g1~~TRINITY_DN640_c0_g1_i1.p1  ORF type:complete len:199 (+),score=63.46 TRINITY_DN640_c0_g1_i1:153-749(+)
MAEKLQPRTVLYCAVCSMPPEYCEFSPDFEKCKPWLIANSPETYPELLAAVKEVEDKLENLTVKGSEVELPPSASLPGKEKSQTPVDEEVKKLPGGRVKKKEKLEIVVEKATRNKRKSVTTVKGLDLFGIKLSDAAKKFGKKFASGASVVKGAIEKEQIDVQGDIMVDVVDFITSTWPEVPESAIYFLEDGKKVSATN